MKKMIFIIDDNDNEDEKEDETEVSIINSTSTCFINSHVLMKDGRDVVCYAHYIPT